MAHEEKHNKEIVRQKAQFDFDEQEYRKYFTEEYLQTLQEYTEQLIDRTLEAHRQMQEEGIEMPPVTGDHIQDVLDTADYSNEILSRAGLLGELEEEKEEL